MLVLTPFRFLAGEYPGWMAVAAATVFLGLGTGIFILQRGTKQWIASVKQSLAAARQLAGRLEELGLIALWLVLPIGMVWAASRILGRPYVFRYSIGASPALYLLLALLMKVLRKLVPDALFLGSILILAAPGLSAYYAEDTRENWRAAAAHVEGSIQRGEAVVVPSRVLGLEAFRWYYGGTVLECDVPGVREAQNLLVTAARTCAEDSDRFWLILRETFVPDGRRLEESAWRRAGLVLVEERIFKGVVVYLFEVGEQGWENHVEQRGGRWVPFLATRPANQEQAGPCKCSPPRR